MCIMCEGSSREESLARFAATIDEHGFMTVGVHGAPDGSGGADDPDWAYTVGLLDHAGHPELIIAGPAHDAAGRLLGQIGRRVLAGERFEAGDGLRIPEGVARFGEVHPIQYRLPTFAAWHGLAEIGVVRSELRALQVIVPTAWFCPVHGAGQPQLALEHERVGVARPLNRAARRARARGWG